MVATENRTIKNDFISTYLDAIESAALSLQEALAEKPPDLAGAKELARAIKFSTDDVRKKLLLEELSTSN